MQGMRRGAEMYADDVSVAAGAVATLCAMAGQVQCTAVAGAVSVGAQAVHAAATCFGHGPDPAYIYDRACRGSASALSLNMLTLGMGQAWLLYAHETDVLAASGWLLCGMTISYETQIGIPQGFSEQFDATERPN